MSKKIIFYELNEIPKKVVEFSALLYPDSALSLLAKYSRKYETIAQDIGHLSPWITWPSLHRGVSNKLHQIRSLGQNLTDVNVHFPTVWDIISRADLKVGVFGSLQSYPLPKNVNDYCFYVPDTFAAGSECFPEKLSRFQEFNLGLVARQGRDPNKELRLKNAIQFLKFSPHLGLSARTALNIAKQIISERFIDDRTVRRRTIQIEIAFDFYFKALCSTKPDISFFFTNHVASSMHRYWPAVFPQDYDELKYDKEWINRWKDEIPYTLRVANYQLTKLMRFVQMNSGWRLIVASSMGQAAVQDRPAMFNQALITDPSKLLQCFGIKRDQYELNLTMAPKIFIRLKTAESLKKIEEIKKLEINGEKLKVDILKKKEVELSIEPDIINQNSLTVSYQTISCAPAKNYGIELVYLRDHSGANAYHIPQGVMLDYDPTKSSRSSNWEKVSALSVTPTLLGNFNIQKPSYMIDPLVVS